MKNKIIIITTSLFVAVILLVIFGGKKEEVKSNEANIKRAGNVYMEDGKQIIEIGVRGGYSPRESFASSGVPTILRMVTKNTFDCSSAIRIPDFNINETLKNTDKRDFDVGVPRDGRVLGSCSMGMYNFSITFK